MPRKYKKKIHGYGRVCLQQPRQLLKKPTKKKECLMTAKQKKEFLQPYVDSLVNKKIQNNYYTLNSIAELFPAAN